MNIIKKILDTSSPSSPTDLNEIVSITSAQLFLKRSPSSPKGELECICNDCVASIRKTTIPFNYQLSIQKLYQEDELDNEDGFESNDDSSFDTLLKDEWEFLIDESLGFQKNKDESGVSISWRELNGDYGDRFQLIIDSRQVKNSTIDLFINTIYRCVYERKYNTESVEISDKQLISEFAQTGNDEDQLYKQFDKNLRLKNESEDDSSDNEDFHDASDGSNNAVPQIKGDVVYKGTVGFYLFDPKEIKFKAQDKEANLSIIRHTDKNFEYTLLVNSKKPVYLPLSTSMNPVFDFDSSSFVFNSIKDGKSYLLKFENFDELSSFQENFKISLWESLNKIKWLKVNEDDKDYILNDDDDLILEGNEEESDSDSETEFENANLKFSNKNDDEDADEEQLLKRQYVKKFSKNVNSHLVVGAKNNRTFVSRGDTLGVFKDDGDDDLKFHVAIENIKAPNSSKTFNPSKMMLHMEDRAMILQDPNARDHLFKMDLERGKIVDDYYIKDGLNVVDYNPTSKLGQLTGEQTFVGISGQGLFKIDPRLSGDKLVENEYKSYASKNDFSTITTTGSGHLAVASNKGDIRLYDKLGKIAKTQLPALGEPIIGLDVSKDGKWLLATCRTHLLLVDTTIRDGKNEGASGFLKSFGKDTKPRPKRITLSPEHIAFMVSEKFPLSFSKAYFNIDVNSQEQTIVTSSGPYVITWSLKKILKNDKSYLIKKYSNNVISDNFKFGDDKKVIIALEDDVAMVNKKSFKKPTRESLGYGGVVKTYY